MFDRVKHLWRSIVSWFKSGGHEGAPGAGPSHTPPPPSKDESAKEESAPPKEPSSPWSRHANPQPESVPQEATGAEQAQQAPAARAPEPARPPADDLAGLNRNDRRLYRKLEKRRLKLDKFVTPNGPQPSPNGRAKHEKTNDDKPTVTPPEPVQLPIVAPSDVIIEGSHPCGDEKVLYKPQELFEFCFRDTILDQLDRYFVYLRRMKLRDPGAFELYRQVGASLVPYLATGLTRDRKSMFEYERSKEGWKLDDHALTEIDQGLACAPAFNRYRPGFGCCAFATNPLDEEIEMLDIDGGRVWIPKFMYFTKYERPPTEYQPFSGGDFYEVTVWWDKPQETGKQVIKRLKGGGAPEMFGIFISRDGSEVRALKSYVHAGRKGPADKRNWRWPRQQSSWAKRHGIKVDKFLVHVFLVAAKSFENFNLSMVRINVFKGDLMATFGVNVDRLPYFFQDRDVTLTVNGKKRKVFHMVRTHVRHTKTGESQIKLHFRGEHEFDWAQYRVEITVPQRDTGSLFDFDLGAVDVRRRERGEKFIGMKEIGKRLASLVSLRERRAQQRRAWH